MDLNYFDRMALSTYSSLEKQSLYQLLCGAMVIDGNRDSREVAVINEVNRVMNITASDLEASRKLTEPQMVNCLRGMDTLKKAYAAKFMAQVILADGVVTQREESFFYYMKERLNLPDMG
jgi:hypothetical protein